MPQFTPIDHDPFSEGQTQKAQPKMVAVDFDPFAKNSPSTPLTEAHPGETVAPKGFIDRATEEIHAGAEEGKKGIETMMNPKSYLQGFKGLGQAALGGMQAAYAPVTAGAEKAGQFVTEKTGSSLAGKATEIGLELLPPGKALGVGERIGRTMTGISANGAKLGAASKGLYEASQNTVNKIKNGSVVFDTSVGKDISKGLHETADSLTGAGKINAESLVKKLKAYAGTIDAGETTLHNFFDIRRGLVDLAGTPGAEGEASRAAIKKIDSILDNTLTKAKVVGGDPENAGLIKQFNSQWKQFKSHEALSDVLNTEGSNKIRGKLLKFIDSDQYKFLSPEIKQAVQKAAKGRTSDKILSGVGSIKGLLNAGGRIPGAPILEAGLALGSGNVPVAAGIGGVMAAGKAAELSTKGDVARILKSIQAGK